MEELKESDDSTKTTSLDQGQISLSVNEETKLESSTDLTDFIDGQLDKRKLQLDEVDDLDYDDNESTSDETINYDVQDNNLKLLNEKYKVDDETSDVGSFDIPCDVDNWKQRRRKALSFKTTSSSESADNEETLQIKDLQELSKFTKEIQKICPKFILKDTKRLLKKYDKLYDDYSKLKDAVYDADNQKSETSKSYNNKNLLDDFLYKEFKDLPEFSPELHKLFKKRNRFCKSLKEQQKLLNEDIEALNLPPDELAEIGLVEKVNNEINNLLYQCDMFGDGFEKIVEESIPDSWFTEQEEILRKLSIKKANLDQEMNKLLDKIPIDDNVPQAYKELGLTKYRPI